MILRNKAFKFIRPIPSAYAEIAAKNFREDVQAQSEYLGGPITEVNSAVMNNGACSLRCARALTDYIGREDVTVTYEGRGKGGRGVLDNVVLNHDVMAEMRAEYGGVSNMEAMTLEAEAATMAVDGALG